MENITEEVFLAGDATNAADTENQASSSQVNLQNVMDFSNVCRTCATVTDFFIPIFEGEGLQNNLADKIQKHLPITVTERDRLPVVVCYQCASTLLAWHELVQCSVQADVALRARLLEQQRKPSESDQVAVSIEDNEFRWKPCSVNSAPPSTHSEYDEAGESENDMKLEEINNGTSQVNNFSGRCSTSQKRQSLYLNFYNALVNFRNHYTTKHDSLKCNNADLSDESLAEQGADDDDDTQTVDINDYDDLSHCNMRKDKMDEETKQELSRALTKLNGKTVYTCNVCGKSLRSANSYQYHRRIHSGARPCVCHRCGKQFRAPAGLARHLHETHERRREHACALCRKTFLNSQNLKHHMRIHSGERPHACAVCGKRFTHSGTLHAHIKTHSDTFPHACPQCGARFRLRAGLRRHALRHSGERPHACAACGKTFRQRHDLNNHARLHTDEKPFVCALCGASFKLRKALRNHTKRMHEADADGAVARDVDHQLIYTNVHYQLGEVAEATEESSSPCAFCGVPLGSCAAVRNKHLLAAHLHQLLHCEDCGTYVNKADFVLHSTEEYPDNERNGQQHEPEPDYLPDGNINTDEPPPPNLERENTYNESSVDEPVECNTSVEALNDAHNEFSDHSDADYEFSPLPKSVFEAIEDSQDSQTGERSTACPSGTPNTNAADGDDSHTVCDTVDPPTVSQPPKTNQRHKKSRICPVCSKVYQASSSYFYHLRYAHNDKKEHECTICGKKFGTKVCLTQHTSAVHTAEYSFECKECAKKFRSKASLYIHEQSHGGLKRWSCSRCSRSFRWRTHLQRHVQRHAAQKTHACPTCGRAFTLHYDLLRHQRTHQAQAHKCPHCQRSFAQKRYLKVHVDKKHKTLISESPNNK